MPVAQSETFHQAYREANLDSKLVMVADAGHYGGSRYFGRNGPRKPVLDFLRKHLRQPAVQEQEIGEIQASTSR